VLYSTAVVNNDQLYSPTSVVDSIQGNGQREKEINSLHCSTKNHNLQQYLQNRLIAHRGATHGGDRGDMTPHFLGWGDIV